MIEAGAFTLRPWRGDDTAFVFDACQDPDISRWTRVPKPYRPGDAAAFVRAHARPQPEPAGAWFAITRTETGELLGAISLHDLDRAAARGELGYWLAAGSRGEGAAAASLDALARWCLEELELVEVEVRVAPGNLASQKVADRAGFSPHGVVPGGCNDGDEAVDALVFVRKR
jgi:RimJ/RimL family protein N-acetyltransferase